MTDTGNLLKDPISGKSVIVTDIKFTSPILPDSIRQAILYDKIEYLDSLPLTYSGKIRLIPSKSISGDRLLIGLIPDKIIVHSSSGDFETPAIFAPAKIHDLPDGYTAIIPGNLNK